MNLRASNFDENDNSNSCYCNVFSLDTCNAYTYTICCTGWKIDNIRSKLLAEPRSDFGTTATSSSFTMTGKLISRNYSNWQRSCVDVVALYLITDTSLSFLLNNG